VILNRKVYRAGIVLITAVLLLAGCGRKEKGPSDLLSPVESHKTRKVRRKKIKPLPVLLGQRRDQIQKTYGIPPHAEQGFVLEWGYDWLLPDYECKIRFTRGDNPEQSFVYEVDIIVAKIVAVPNNQPVYFQVPKDSSEEIEPANLPSYAILPEDLLKGRDLILPSVLQQEPKAFGDYNMGHQELLAIWPLGQQGHILAYFVQKEKFWEYQFDSATGSYSKLVLTTPKDQINWGRLPIVRYFQDTSDIKETVDSLWGREMIPF